MLDFTELFMSWKLVWEIDWWFSIWTNCLIRSFLKIGHFENRLPIQFKNQKRDWQTTVIYCPRIFWNLLFLSTQTLISSILTWFKNSRFLRNQIQELRLKRILSKISFIFLIKIGRLKNLNFTSFKIKYSIMKFTSSGKLPN